MEERQMDIQRELRHLKWAVAGVFALFILGGVWAAANKDGGQDIRDEFKQLEILNENAQKFGEETPLTPQPQTDLGSIKFDEAIGGRIDESNQACKEAEAKRDAIARRHETISEQYFNSGGGNHTEYMAIMEDSITANDDVLKLCYGD
jgi:hypothetical protein